MKASMERSKMKSKDKGGGSGWQNPFRAIIGEAAIKEAALGGLTPKREEMALVSSLISLNMWQGF